VAPVTKVRVKVCCGSSAYYVWGEQMGVASHLHIRIEDYDNRIRTFIPGYEEMIAAAAQVLAVLDEPAPHVVDLGTGTGALAAACLHVRPDARITAIDADGEILDLARQRLSGHAVTPEFITGVFEQVALPACNAILASLSLHHIRTDEAKRLLYRQCREVLSPGGLLISADCCPASDRALAWRQHLAWRDHLRLTYSDAEADAFFAAWAEEDVYFSLEDELTMMRSAALSPDVVWRAGAMAVIVARR
jgi:SAM-dependent methyltransferase